MSEPAGQERATPLDGIAPAVLADPPPGSGVAVAEQIRPSTANYVIPRVMLVVEGTYPFHWGGVSTWCDHLIHGLPEVPFSVLAITTQPGLQPLFDRPANIVDFRAVPLWGLKDPAEADRHARARQLHRGRTGSTDAAIRAGLLPPLRSFLEALFEPQCDPHRLADSIHQIYRFLLGHDFDRAFRSRAVWDMCLEVFQQAYQVETAARGGTELTLADLTTAYQWMCRWFFPLARPLPEVGVVHAAMAGTCSIVCVAAQREFGAGYFLTEHGVYLRERYIAESTRSDSYFLKYVGLSFSRRITEMSYALADQISPCCDYNQRWELQVGACADQLQTIYYAVDDEAYRSSGDRTEDPTTVVWVGRINPLKDVETLLRAAALVAARIPEARFLLYGSAPAEDAEYHARCLALHDELGLAGVVTFCGYTNDSAAAYNSGDVVVLSSVSEGFPYSTLEAMLCGKPIVATSVGGIPEQIEGCGIIVEPRDPRAMAEALLSLLGDQDRCTALGAAARHRASSIFGMGGFVLNHLETYRALSPHGDRKPPLAARTSEAPAAQCPGPPPRGGTAASLKPLVAQVQARTSTPVDDLEVAAILESTGMTDAKADDDYGYADVFVLATRVYELVRSVANPGRRPVTQLHPVPVDSPTTASHLDNARHPVLALLPSAALLSILWTLTSFGRWPSQRVLTVALGMTAGMLFTNGFTIAMAPRASALISFGRVRTARRFLLCCTALAVACTLGLTEAVLALHWSVLSLLNRDPRTFIAAAVTLSVVWCLAGSLSLVGLSGWVGTALSAGVVTALAIDQLCRGWLWAAGTVGALAGLALTLGLLVLALERELRARGIQGSPNTRLPGIGYLALEALPYYLYGTLGVALIISVHVVGWASIPHGASGQWGNQISTLELGLFLPLPPAVLMAAHSERTLRHFWQEASSLQATIPAARAQAFGRCLEGVYREHARRYLQRLSALSLVVLIGVAVTMWFVPAGTGWNQHPRALLILVSTGLLGYGLLGWAQFNAMFGLSMLAWRGPLRAAATGTVVVIVGAIALIGMAGYQAAGGALIAGAGIYALLAWRHRRQLLASAFFHYVMAV